MSAVTIYLAYGAAVAVSVGLVLLLARRGAPALALYGLGGVLAALLALFLFKVSLPGEVGGDFDSAYLPAGALVMEAPARLKESLRQGVQGFVNLPILAYLFTPFALIGGKPAMLGFSALMLACAALAWRHLVRLADLDATRAALLLILFGASGPLIYSIREANTTHGILALLTAALLCLRARRDVLAGALIGVAALIKLPLLLFGVYFVLRRRWRAVLGGAAACAGAAALSVLVFGWDLHLYWYEMGVKPYSENPIGAHNVQGVTAAILRLAHGAPLLGDWRPRPMEPELALAARLVVAALLAGAAWAFWAPRPKDAKLASPEQAQTLELLIVLMLALAISPVTWAHYYCWALIPAAYLLSPAWSAPIAPALRVAGLAGAALIALPIIRWTPGHPLAAELNARLLESNMIIGGLVVLFALMWARWSLRPAPLTRDAPGAGAKEAASSPAQGEGRRGAPSAGIG